MLSYITIGVMGSGSSRINGEGEAEIVVCKVYKTSMFYNLVKVCGLK